MVHMDTVYSVEATDADGDGCEELIFRQYAWQECHANHKGDMVSTWKVEDNRLFLVNASLEGCFN